MLSRHSPSANQRALSSRLLTSPVVPRLPVSSFSTIPIPLTFHSIPTATEDAAEGAITVAVDAAAASHLSLPSVSRSLQQQSWMLFSRCVLGNRAVLGRVSNDAIRPAGTAARSWMGGVLHMGPFLRPEISSAPIGWPCRAVVSGHISAWWYSHYSWFGSTLLTTSRDNHLVLRFSSAINIMRFLAVTYELDANDQVLFLVFRCFHLCYGLGPDWSLHLVAYGDMMI
nr:hypothetical protein Iba_chr04cCG15320 [Ipomoea batatas]